MQPTLLHVYLKAPAKISTFPVTQHNDPIFILITHIINVITMHS